MSGKDIDEIKERIENLEYQFEELSQHLEVIFLKLDEKISRLNHFYSETTHID